MKCEQDIRDDRYGARSQIEERGHSDLGSIKAARAGNPNR